MSTAMPKHTDTNTEVLLGQTASY